MTERGQANARVSVTRLAGLLAIPLAALTAGCVDRKFVIESNVSNAQVYVDNKPVGPAPAYVPFEYYGHYNVTVVRPGYETQTRRIHVTAPWYAYPPFDFITEVLWPFHIRDTRRYHLELVPAAPIRTDDILGAAEGLRQRGMTLPPPERPAEPRQPRQPAPPAPILGAPVAPGTVPAPNAEGFIPSVVPN